MRRALALLLDSLIALAIAAAAAALAYKTVASWDELTIVRKAMIARGIADTGWRGELLQAIWSSHGSAAELAQQLHTLLGCQVEVGGSKAGGDPGLGLVYGELELHVTYYSITARVRG